MSDHTSDYAAQQGPLIEAEAARSLLDQLLADSRLYTQSKDYKELLDFVVRLRNFAPFNAMLLQVQKPGLRYAASARDWRERFGRWPKDSARPLLILWPFGPVALVYDVMDTDGKELPEDVASFFAHGSIDDMQIVSFEKLINRKNIKWDWIDGGDGNAGSIIVVKRAINSTDYTRYQMDINRNHSTAIKFTTLAHELGHLFLGHLGPDRKLNVPERPKMTHAQAELEAESVAYLVCARNGVTSKSETYLKDYVQANTTVDHVDLYQVMRAAGQVETLLNLTAHTKYERPIVGGHGTGVATEYKPVSSDDDIDHRFGKEPTKMDAPNSSSEQEAAEVKANQLNVGIYPELMQVGFTTAGYHLEKGVRTFSAYTKAMINDFGNKIKPYLKSLYNGVRDLPGIESIAKDMDSYDTVLKADIEEILKEPVGGKWSATLNNPVRQDRP